MNDDLSGPKLVVTAMMIGLVVPFLRGVSAAEPQLSSVDLEQRTAAEISATFSIVAVDPETGECGAAVASKFPAVGEVVPYVRAGVGAFCTQHWHNPEWGERALDLMEDGMLPEAVLAELLKDDPRQEK
ncbi:MAG: DUF1028 domain-containing protein, partial [Planctomycetaceae bacterium]|nr:DUF1028 domain-containing protein [Planctomycetaceae bacterium]